MELYYIFLIIVFIIVFIGWWIFESGAIIDAYNFMEKQDIDKKTK